MKEYILCNDSVCEGDLIAKRLEIAIIALQKVRDHTPFDDMVAEAYVDCKLLARDALSEAHPIEQ